MKTKLLFLVLLVASSIYASPQKEIAEVKKNLNAEKRNVTQLSNKRDNVITSYQIAAKEYVIAKAKQDSLSHKPNSLAYKNAVKKTEKYEKKKDELSSSMEVLKLQIDSINALVTNYESILLELQNKQDVETQKHTQKRKVKQRNQESIKETNATEEVDIEDVPIEKDEQVNTIIQTSNSATDIKQDKTDISESNKDIESKKNVPNWQNWLYTIGIGLLGVILFYYELKKNSRCPRCGKWFSYDEIGRSTVGRKGNDYIHHIKYKCRNCGYHHTKEVKTNAKNKYDVS